MGFIGRSLRHKLAWAADCALKPFLDNVALLMEKLVRVFDQGILIEPDGSAYLLVDYSIHYSIMITLQFE